MLFLAMSAMLCMKGHFLSLSLSHLLRLRPPLLLHSAHELIHPASNTPAIWEVHEHELFPGQKPCVLMHMPVRFSSKGESGVCQSVPPILSPSLLLLVMLKHGYRKYRILCVSIIIRSISKISAGMYSLTGVAVLCVLTIKETVFQGPFNLVINLLPNIMRAQGPLY